MTKIQELIKRGYEATKARNQITDKTTKFNFCYKIREETIEAEQDLFNNAKEENFIGELGDIAQVCINAITHLGYDFVEELEKVVEKNERRALNTKK
jgi:NTP pyrophosphatase (non-canonical NTP hydrolase)